MFHYERPGSNSQHAVLPYASPVSQILSHLQQTQQNYGGNTVPAPFAANVAPYAPIASILQLLAHTQHSLQNPGATQGMGMMHPEMSGALLPPAAPQVPGMPPVPPSPHIAVPQAPTPAGGHVAPQQGAPNWISQYMPPYMPPAAAPVRNDDRELQQKMLEEQMRNIARERW